MKGKDTTRVIAGGSLAAILAVHFLPRRLLPLASPALATLFILGGLLFVHRHPLKGLWRDLTEALEGKSSVREACISCEERELRPTTDGADVSLLAPNEEPAPAAQF